MVGNSHTLKAAMKTHCSTAMFSSDANEITCQQGHVQQ
jgi:hypothetical protein